MPLNTVCVRPKGTAYGGCGWTTEIPRYLDVYLYGTYNNGDTDVWSTNEYCTDCRIRGYFGGNLIFGSRFLKQI